MPDFAPSRRRQLNCAALTARKLTKRYGRRLVLSHFDLQLLPGSSTWLTGPPGAGKSTLLRCLAGAERFDSGTVMVAGHSPVERPVSGQQRIGYAPPQAPLLPYLSPVEHLHLWGGLSGGGAEDVLRGAAMLEELAIHEVRHDAVRDLCPLQAQQLSLIGALQNSPDLLLLDIPDGAVKISGSDACRRFVEAYRLSGGAVLFTTSDREWVDELATDQIDLVPEIQG